MFSAAMPTLFPCCSLYRTHVKSGCLGVSEAKIWYVLKRTLSGANHPIVFSSILITIQMFIAYSVYTTGILQTYYWAQLVQQFRLRFTVIKLSVHKFVPPSCRKATFRSYRAGDESDSEAGSWQSVVRTATNWLDSTKSEGGVGFWSGGVGV